MRTPKKILALLIALVMVLSAMPTAFAAATPEEAPNEELGLWVDGQFVPVDWTWPAEEDEPPVIADDGESPESLLPIKEVNKGTIDLTTYFDEELKHAKLSDSFWGIVTGSEGEETGELNAVWSLNASSQQMNDEFNVYDPETGIDLTMLNGDVYRSYVYLQVIVGEHAEDQFATDNVRYLFYVRLPYRYDSLSESLFSYELYAPAAEGEDPVNVPILEISNGYYSSGEYVLGLCIAEEYSDQELTLKVVPKNEEIEARNLTADVYVGRYETIEDAEANGDKLTDEGVTANYFEYPYQEFSVVLKRGTASKLEILHIYTRTPSVGVSFSPYSDMSTTEGEFTYDTRCYYTSDIKYTNEGDYYVDEYTVMLQEGFAANDKYYVRFDAYGSGVDETGNDQALISHAAVGLLSRTELENLSDANDIKDELFADETGAVTGYGADYSGGVFFSILTKYGSIERFMVKTIEYAEREETLPSAPMPKSQDTYLNLYDAYKPGENDEDGYDRYAYDTHVMFYGDDDYYYRGYQTIFVLNRGDGSAVTDEKIIPAFTVGSKIKLFLGNGADAAQKIENENNLQAVEANFGEPHQYSVAAEDGVCLKNYWITFLTRTENGPDLFINGITNIDKEHLDEETGEPVREITLDSTTRFYHDVFFANIGNEDITDLTVSLDEEAQQYITIDEYWSAENETIPAFTDMNEYIGDSHYYTTYGVGELKNVGKVRLIPKDIEGYANISGYLTFKYTAANNEQKEIKVKLTGIAGDPSITTETVPNGVKFVPYDCLIQTNSMGESDALAFRLANGSKLPAGLTLFENGEIYGMPTEVTPEDYTFTVELTDKSGNIVYDTAEYTLKIVDNSDEAVYTASDENYELKQAVGTQDGDYHFVLDSYSEQVFTSAGTFGEFYALYIDGKKVDETLYDKEEGSTVITIHEEAFEDTGSGTHTIAAEFHPDGEDEDGLPNGNVKRTAQNYTIEGSSYPSGPSNPSNPGGGGSTPSAPTNPDKGEDTTTPPTHECASEKYPDLDENKWYHEAVDYALEQGLFEGYSDGTFRPSGTITRAQALTVLARFSGVDTTGSDPWYQAGLNWALEKGISDGTNLGNSISRQEIVTMLWRFAGSHTSSASLSAFPDASSVASWAQPAMAWAVENGIILGREDGTIDPLANASRAEFAAVMYRYLQLIQ